MLAGRVGTWAGEGHTLSRAAILSSWPSRFSSIASNSRSRIGPATRCSVNRFFMATCSLGGRGAYRGEDRQLSGLNVMCSGRHHVHRHHLLDRSWSRGAQGVGCSMKIFYLGSQYESSFTQNPPVAYQISRLQPTEWVIRPVPHTGSYGRSHSLKSTLYPGNTINNSYKGELRYTGLFYICI